MTAVHLIAVARQYLGTKEVTRNSSPLIDAWLRHVNQVPGASWCSAFVCSVVEEADPENRLRKSASALRLLELYEDLLISGPEVGAIVIWCHDPVKHLGHCGLVTGVVEVGDAFAGIEVLSGNTNAQGSREGTLVGEKGYPLPDAQIVGYLRVTSPDADSGVERLAA